MSIGATTRQSGVVFDLDGTLVDSEPIWIRGFTIGLTRILEARGYGRRPVDLADMWKYQGSRVPDTVGTILRSLGLQCLISASETRAIVNEVIDYAIKEFIDQPAPITEAVSAAQALHAEGVPMAVASSSAIRFIDAVLDSLGLQDAFPVRVSALDLANGKPDPAVYLLALQQLGLPPERALAVEDSRVGVAAAVNAQMRCVWYMPGELQGLSLLGRQDLGVQLKDLVDNQSDIPRLVTVAGRVDHALLTQVLGQLNEGSER